MSITIGDAVLYLESNNAGLKRGLADAKKTVAAQLKYMAKSFATDIGVSTQSLASLASFVGGAGIAIGALAAAAGIAKTAYTQLISPLIDYNKAILDSARATGMSVEEMSRLVQVGDDVGVSMETITTALEMATKNGFRPTLPAIADLADQVNGMNDPTERAAYLAKILGRNWAAIDPILQLGKTRILELAAAQSDGLVVTEEEIEKTEEARLALDAFNDTMTAAKNTAAITIVPLFTDLISFSSRLVEAFGEVDSHLPIISQLEFLAALRDSRVATEEETRETEIYQRALEALKAQGIEPTKGAVSAMADQIRKDSDQASADIALIRARIANLPKRTNLEVVTYHWDEQGKPSVGTSHPSYEDMGFWWVWSSAAGHYIRGAATGAAPRAEGGPVERGKPYLVGEEQPEIFVPDQSGRIVPKSEPTTVVHHHWNLTAQYGHQSERSLRDDIRILELLHG